MASRLRNTRFRPTDPSTGRPFPGGTVEIFENRSTSPAIAYHDAAQTRPASTFQLNSNGEAEIWIAGTVRVVVKDLKGDVRDTIDDVSSTGSGVAAAAAVAGTRSLSATTLAQSIPIAEGALTHSTGVLGLTSSTPLTGYLVVGEECRVRFEGGLVVNWADNVSVEGLALEFRPTVQIEPFTDEAGNNWVRQVLATDIISVQQVAQYTAENKDFVDSGVLSFSFAVPSPSTDQPTGALLFPTGTPITINLNVRVLDAPGGTLQESVRNALQFSVPANTRLHLEQLNPYVAVPGNLASVFNNIISARDEVRATAAAIRTERGEQRIIDFADTPAAHGMPTQRLVVNAARDGFDFADKSFSDAEKTKLAGIEANATADQTPSEIAQGLDTFLGHQNWRTGSSPGSSGLTQVATGDSITGDGTVGDPLNIATTFLASSTSPGLMSSAEHTKLAGIEASATADQTGTEIASLLDTHFGNTHWRTGGTNPTTLASTIATAFANFEQSGPPDNARFLFESQAGQGVNLLGAATLQQFATSLEGLLDTEPGDTWAFQTSVLEVFESTQDDAHSIPTGSSDPQTFRVAFKGSVRSDEADVGFSHASGRMSFTNISSSVRTTLRLTGKLPYYNEGVNNAVVQVYLREYNSLNVQQPDQLLFQTAKGGAGRVNTDLVLGDTPVTVIRGNTYEVVVVTTPSGAASGAEHGIRANADSADLVAFRRWVADESDEVDAASVRAVMADVIDDANEITTLNADDKIGVYDDSADAYGFATIESISAFFSQHEVSRILSQSFKTALSGNDVLRLFDNGTVTNRRLRLSDLSNFINIFPEVTSLASLPTEDGQRAFLTAASNGNPEGFYVEEPSGVVVNLVRFVPATDPLSATIHGANNDPAGVFGDIDIRDDHWLGGFVFSVENPPYVNVKIPNALALDTGTQTFYVRVTAPSGEVADFTINEGSESENFTRGGVTFRTFPADLGVGGLSSSQRTLLEALIASEGSDEPAEMLVYTDSARTQTLAIHDARKWGALYDQQHLKPLIEEEEASKRLIQLAKVGTDYPYLGSFDTLADAASVITNDNAGKEFDVQDTSTRSTEIARYLIRAGYAGTGGVKGQTSRRNRIKFRLIEMGNRQGYYWTANALNNVLVFDNVQDKNRIDASGMWVWVSFYDGPGNPYVDVGLSNAIGNRETFTIIATGALNASGVASSETLDFRRVAGQSGTFGGRTGHTFRCTLTPQVAARLRNREWEFDNGEVTLDLINSATVTTPIAFNPDEVQFFSGSGQVNPSGVIAPEAVLVSGRSENLLAAPVTVTRYGNTGTGFPNGWISLGITPKTGIRYEVDVSYGWGLFGVTSASEQKFYTSDVDEVLNLGNDWLGMLRIHNGTLYATNNSGTFTINSVREVA